MDLKANTLASLHNGESGTVSRLNNRRLYDLGITPGTQLTLLRRAPSGDPSAIRVRGCVLALGGAAAADIELGGSEYKVRHYARHTYRIVRTKTSEKSPRGELRFALAGNPNCGKTTLFNALTGSDQYVGNWPGVTVDRKEGKAESPSGTVLITDLPGTYSLSPYSEEEHVTVDFLSSDGYDAVINVVDATNLERNLNLTIQLMRLGRPVIVALGFMDQLKGREPDSEALSRILGVPVVPISARSGKNLDLLMERASDCAVSGAVPDAPYSDWEEIAAIVREVSRGPDTGGGLTDTIDDIVTNKYLALPIFLLIIMGVFALTFGPVGTWLTAGVHTVLENILCPWTARALAAAGAPGWLQSLITDGVIGGAGSVLSFLPQVGLLFLCLSVLEDCGYMARAAFIMDRAMRSIGLSGKAFIPLLMGFGCSVPAVLSVRTLSSDRDRILTMLLVPFMSCSAKLPVYGLIASAFFAEKSVLAVAALYVLGAVTGLASGFALRKTIFKGGGEPFIMELPPYRMPTLMTTARHVWERMRSFIKRAGTLIFAVSVALWFLKSMDMQLCLTNDISRSILGCVGMAVSPVFSPLGFGCTEAAAALMAGLAAKEAVVAALGLAAGTSAAALAQVFSSPAAAYSFLVFVLLYTPCAATLAAVHKEASTGAAMFMAVWQFVLAWVMSFSVYSVGSILL